MQPNSDPLHRPLTAKCLWCSFRGSLFQVFRHEQETHPVEAEAFYEYEARP
jgi:hypothetical protein